MNTGVGDSLFQMNMYCGQGCESPTQDPRTPRGLPHYPYLGAPGNCLSEVVSLP